MPENESKRRIQQALERIALFLDADQPDGVHESSRILASAAFDQDVAWDEIADDFEALVQKLAADWEAPVWQFPRASDTASDFFQASINWPPGLASRGDEPTTGSDRFRHRLPNAERAACWKQHDRLVYIALELLDNTRVRAIIIGVLQKDQLCGESVA